MNKTNAMRQLDSAKIPYNEVVYEVTEDVDGISVADKLQQPHASVYKTLVTKGASEYYVFVVPITHELDLKKAAQSVGAKKIEMILKVGYRKIRKTRKSILSFLMHTTITLIKRFSNMEILIKTSIF